MLVLMFQIGDNRLALDIRRVREVVPRVHLDRPTMAPDWLAGLFVYRGHPVPVLDLHHLLGAGECPPHLSSRIILVPLEREGGDERLIGLLAAQVADIREINANAPSMPSLDSSSQARLGQTLVEGDTILHLLDLDHLLPDPVRKRLPPP